MQRSFEEDYPGRRLTRCFPNHCDGEVRATERQRSTLSFSNANSSLQYLHQGQSIPRTHAATFPSSTRLEHTVPFLIPTHSSLHGPDAQLIASNQRPRVRAPDYELEQRYADWLVKICLLSV